jgi:hypothetical protein
MQTILLTSLLALSLNSTEAIKDHINARAQYYSYPIVKALYIAQCESEFIHDAKSKTSSASGIFQFINGTWYGVMEQLGLPTTTPKTDPVFNIEAGLFLLDKEGDRHWAESKPCWLPKYQRYLSTLNDS